MESKELAIRLARALVYHFINHPSLLLQTGYYLI